MNQSILSNVSFQLTNTDVVPRNTVTFLNEESFEDFFQRHKKFAIERPNLEEDLKTPYFQVAAAVTGYGNVMCAIKLLSTHIQFVANTLSPHFHISSFGVRQLCDYFMTSVVTCADNLRLHEGNGAKTDAEIIEPLAIFLGVHFKREADYSMNDWFQIEVRTQHNQPDKDVLWTEVGLLKLNFRKIETA